MNTCYVTEHERMSPPPSPEHEPLHTMPSIRKEDLSKLCVHFGKPITANELPTQANVVPLDWTKASQPISLGNTSLDVQERLRKKLKEKKNQRNKHAPSV